MKCKRKINIDLAIVASQMSGGTIHDTDAHCASPPRIEVGDLMFVLAKFTRTTRPLRKLSERYLGPFEVTDKPSMHSYQVKLPHHLRVIHPVFHISQLEPANQSQIPSRVNPPPPPITVDSELEYEISQILDSKLDHRRKPPLLYYVHWAGYERTDEEFSWLSTSELSYANELIHDFHTNYPSKPGPITLAEPVPVPH